MNGVLLWYNERTENNLMDLNKDLLFLIIEIGPRIRSKKEKQLMSNQIEINYQFSPGGHLNIKLFS